MGYAIFTMRKLSLRTRINQANAQLMILSQRQLNYATQKTQIQIASSTTSAAATLESAKKRQEAIKEFLNADGTLKKDYDAEKLNAALTAATTSTDVNDAETKVQQALYEAQIQEISIYENQIEIQKKALETEVQAYQSEYEMVEKAETGEVKASTPKYNGTQG